MAQLHPPDPPLAGIDVRQAAVAQDRVRQLEPRGVVDVERHPAQLGLPHADPPGADRSAAVGLYERARQQQLAVLRKLLGLEPGQVGSLDRVAERHPSYGGGGAGIDTDPEECTVTFPASLCNISW